MSGSGEIGFGRWRQFMEQVFVGASAAALAFAAFDATAEPIGAALVLIGTALLVELDAAARPVDETDPQPARSAADSEPAQPGAGFDAAIVDATSV